MKDSNILITIVVAIVITVVGLLFIEYNSWLGYTDSAILYLTAVIGAGCYWIGSSHQKR